MVRTGASIGSQMTPAANHTSFLSILKSLCCSFSWSKCLRQCILHAWIQKMSQLPHVPLSPLKVCWDQGHYVCFHKLCPHTWASSRGGLWVLKTACTWGLCTSERPPCLTLFKDAACTCCSPNGLSNRLLPAGPLTSPAPSPQPPVTLTH